MAKPLIIYIGGVPGVGKTSYAEHLAKEFGIGIVLSGDYLREYLKNSMPENSENSILKYSVYDSWKAFGDKTDGNIIKGYLKQGAIINKGIDALIKRARKNGENILIESLYFVPEQIESLKDSDVIKFYIHLSNKEIYKKRLLERTKFTHFNAPGDRLVEEIDTYAEIMDHSLKAAKNSGIRTFDNIDYARTREEILEYVKSCKLKLDNGNISEEKRSVDV